MREKTRGGENRFGEEEGDQIEKKKTGRAAERLHVWVGDKALISDMANREVIMVGLQLGEEVRHWQVKHPAQVSIAT